MDKINVLMALKDLKDAKAVYDIYRLECIKNGAFILQHVRSKGNLTQVQIASQLEVTSSFISKIENGHMSITVPILVKLEAILVDIEFDRYEKYRTCQL